MKWDEVTRQVRFLLTILWLGMIPVVAALAFQGEWFGAGLMFVVVSGMPFMATIALKEARRHLEKK